MSPLQRLRSRVLAGSLIVGSILLATSTPARALQQVYTTTVSGTGQSLPPFTFPLFNPFSATLGKSLILTSVQASLSGTTGGSVSFVHTGLFPGSVTAVSYLPTLANWFNQGGTTVPDQSPPSDVAITANNLPVTSNTNNHQRVVNLIGTAVGPFYFDLTDYLSYFIGTGTGSTELNSLVLGATTGSGFSTAASNYSSFSFTGSNNFTLTYDYSIYDAPGPLPVAGGVAAFGWSRRLRRRLRDGRQTAA